MYAYIVLSLLTGARTEELRALTWDHVDLDGTPDACSPVPPHVAVWRSVRAGGDTKTRKSRHTLALPKRCVDLLRRHREAQQREQGDAWSESGLVFASSTGKPLDAANVRRDFRNAIKDAEGVDPREYASGTPPQLRLTALRQRHTTGGISRLVGHSSMAVTEAVYRKQIRPVLQGGAVAMDQVFREE